jgi:hypothetical protein
MAGTATRSKEPLTARKFDEAKNRNVPFGDFERSRWNPLPLE